MNSTRFTGLVLVVLLTQAVNLLNLMLLLNLVLGNPPMLLAANQILQQVPIVLVQLIAINQALKSLLLLAQSPMLLQALNAHQNPDPDLVQGQLVLALVLVLQNLALLVPNQGLIALNPNLRAQNPNPRAQNLIDLQSLVLQVQNLRVLRVGHVRNPVVEVQEAGSLVLVLAAHHQGPRAPKQDLIYKTADPTLQI